MSEDANAVAEAIVETNPLEGDAKSVADAVEGVEPAAEVAPWYLTEETKGDGDRPEYMQEKFKNLSEQAKAYGELEKRFGGFTGAPEAYELSLNEKIAEAGIEIESDDPLVVKAMEWSKEHNLNQDGFTGLVELFAQSKMAEQTAFEEHRENEIKALGPQAEARLQNIDTWSKTNLPAELHEQVQGLAHSAGAVQALEKIIGMTRSAPMAPDTGAQAAQGVTAEQLAEMQFAKDEYGNRKMQNPEYAKEVRRLANQIHGIQDHRIVIGG